jgi:hypothetical protein
MSNSVDLQFDRAEFPDAATPTACAFCHAAVIGSYFQVNERVACEACRYRLDSAELSGTGVGRFVRAAGAGTAAAIAGALLYYAISALTGYEFGLIAIVVGVGVGSAVRWGSRGRGGWRYQTLAMALTYLAIVATYVPPIVKQVREHAATRVAGEPGSVASPDTSRDAAADATKPPSLGRFLIALVVFAAFVCAVPFLAGLRNIMGLVIIGIGLYEAWKINRRIPLTITGPHVINRAPSASA